MLASRSLEQLVDVLFESGFNGRELSAFDFWGCFVYRKRECRVRDDRVKPKATRIVLVGGQ